MTKEDDFRKHAAETMDLAQKASSSADEPRLLARPNVGWIWRIALTALRVSVSPGSVFTRLSARSSAMNVAKLITKPRSASERIAAERSRLSFTALKRSAI